MKAASQFGRLVQLEPRLLGVLVRAARGETTEPDLETEVRTLTGTLRDYRFRDGREGAVTARDLGHGLFEVLQGEPDLSHVDAVDLVLRVVRRAMPVQQQEQEIKGVA